VGNRNRKGYRRLSEGKEETKKRTWNRIPKVATVGLG